MMELFMYFQIWNLWYYFLCFLILRFYILFPLQAHNPPIRLPRAHHFTTTATFSRNISSLGLPWKQFMGFFPYVFILRHTRRCISCGNGFSCAYTDGSKKLYNFAFFFPSSRLSTNNCAKIEKMRAYYVCLEWEAWGACVEKLTNHFKIEWESCCAKGYSHRYMCGVFFTFLQCVYLRNHISFEARLNLQLFMSYRIVKLIWMIWHWMIIQHCKDLNLKHREFAKKSLSSLKYDSHSFTQRCPCSHWLKDLRAFLPPTSTKKSKGNI